MTSHHPSTEPPPLAALALALTAQDWTSLGLPDGHTENSSAAVDVTATSDFETIVERITALLLVRMVAVAASSQHSGEDPTILTYRDWSTTAICQAHLATNHPWPSRITPQVVNQLRHYVARILQTYATATVTPYHSIEHAYHVTVSMNKVLDLMLNTALPTGTTTPSTYGLRHDPRLHLVLVWSGLIHDAEHPGVPNRQLALEDDPLAILYNDQSVAEHRSLFVSFHYLLEDQYRDLRQVLFFPPHNSTVDTPTHADEYRRFRKAVINLVLTTDLASPERTQIGKSKWKEAFGDPFETVERKVRQNTTGPTTSSANGGRRASVESCYSEITTDADDYSPSITPESSIHGDNPDDDEDYYLSDDDMFSSSRHGSVEDGVIVSSKPFSNVTSSQPGRPVPHTTTTPPKTKPSPTANQSSPSPLPASQLGYEPTDQNTKTTGDNSILNEEALGYETTDPSRQKRTTSNKSLPNPMARRFKKAALPHPISAQARRNRSMSDYRAEHAAQLEQTPPQTKSQKEVAKFQRRFSTSVVGSSLAGGTRKVKYRLGILRAVDLGGEAIETYARSPSLGAGTHASHGSSVPPASGKSLGSTGTDPSPAAVNEEEDMVDELKVTVIMEQLMAACDVAHNLQSWEHMVKWSNRLFLELKKAHQQGRGPDPRKNWYANQIGFLESYLLPLARRLEDTGVFGDVIGPVFANIVEANRDRWLTDGMEVTRDIIAQGAEQYPVGDEIVHE